jgi:phosphonate transport system substrate-binding protein
MVQLLLVIATCIWLTGGVSFAAEIAPLRLGIMPFNSTLALFKTHQPLRQYLQEGLGRPVDLFTAPDYPAFLKETQEGHFDLLITGPHFGVMALSVGYQPLFHYKAVLQPVFVVRTDAPIHGLADLKGKRIGLSSKLSVSSIGGVKWLQDNGLRMGRDYQLVEQPTHGAAVAAVAIGRLDAALTTFTPLKQVPEDILSTSIRTPHLMTLARQRLGAHEIDRIKKLLEHFHQTPQGIAFFSSTGYEGYVPVSNQDIKAMQPYIELTQKLLQDKKP